MNTTNIAATLQDEMKNICQSKNWRTLTGLIDDGYRGMFVILRILNESDGDVVAGDLAKKMNVSTARVASALNTLQNKGYVLRRPDGKDARKVVVCLTEQGAEALEQRKLYVEQTVAPMLANLTDEETATLFALMKKMLQ